MTPQDRTELRRLLSLPDGEEEALQALLEQRRVRQQQQRQRPDHRHGRPRRRPTPPPPAEPVAETDRRAALKLVRG